MINRTRLHASGMGNIVLSRRQLVPFALRAAFVAIPAAALALGSHAQQSDRVKSLGGKLLCPCGCGQILTACNHVGCTYSTKMLQELNDRIGRGDSDAVILQSFEQEYGQTVLAQPPAKGFNVLVWVLPILLPVLAIAAIWGVAQRWRQRATLAPAGGPPIDPSLLARAHRESGDANE
jgi:cytochrome c-type biogenesis protein CcmH/NrfF